MPLTRRTNFLVVDNNFQPRYCGLPQLYGLVSQISTTGHNRRRHRLIPNRASAPRLKDNPEIKLHLPPRIVHQRFPATTSAARIQPQSNAHVEISFFDTVVSYHGLVLVPSLAVRPLLRQSLGRGERLNPQEHQILLRLQLRLLHRLRAHALPDQQQRRRRYCTPPLASCADRQHAASLSFTDIPLLQQHLDQDGR